MTPPHHKIFLHGIDDMPRLHAFFNACQRDMQLSPQNLAELSVIADEVVSNIFLHNRARVEVILVARRKGKQINLHVEDTGIPFNLLEAPEIAVDLPLEEREVGGLGILLARSLSDEIRYRYDKHKNRLTIIKEVD